MRRFPLLTAPVLTGVAAISLLAACVPPSGGYYDERGNYIPYPPADRAVVAPAPGPVYTFERRGYYDYNGYYLPMDSGLSVPRSMFPPRGMCRVWFTDRTASEQPAPESCSGINYRVPAGAYVIYGG